MSEEFDRKSDEYWWKFGEIFPTETYTVSEAKMIAKMDECIRAGKPYDPYEGIPPEERKHIDF